MRIKEQETLLILHEHDYDDDDALVVGKSNVINSVVIHNTQYMQPGIKIIYIGICIFNTANPNITFILIIIPQF